MNSRALGPLLLIVGLAAGFVVAGYFQTSSSSVVAMTVANDREDTDTQTIAATYPQFGISAIDASIKQKVDDAIVQFKKDSAGPLVTSAKNEFLGQFDSAYLGPDVVSVRLSLMQYTGGAHPITPIVGLNYDRASGRELTLGDALALTGLSLKDLAAQAKQELGAKLGDSFMFPDGAEPTPENYATFTIDAKNVTFIFQQYQVAPYAAGVQEVSIPRVK